MSCSRALSVTYVLLERSEKKTSVSAPSPGSPISYSTSSRGTSRSELGLLVGHRGAGRADLHALDRDVDRERRGAGQRAADGLHDPAPVGVAAVQRGFHERRVGDRPGDGLDGLGRARRARARARSAPAPSPSATIITASCAQQRVERLAEAQLVLALGLRPRTPLAPEAIRIAVSLVDSCPSTVTRSKERSTHTPSSRSAVSALSAASVCDEAQHRREARRDHPGALALRAQPHGARTGSSTSRLARFSKRVGRLDRRLEVDVALAGASRRARRRIPFSTASDGQVLADRAGRGERHLGRVDARRERRGALRLGGVVEPAPAGGGVRAAGVGEHGPQRSAAGSARG